MISTNQISTFQISKGLTYNRDR